METLNVTTESSKATIDDKTRELNNLAREQAKKDMAKPKDQKPAKPVTTKPTTEKKPVKESKEPVQRTTDKLDTILHKGGTWAEITAEANKLGGNIKYTASVIKAHIRYRQVTQGKKDYLEGFKVTDTGIEVIKKGKK